MSKLDDILINVRDQKLPDGLGATTSHVRYEAKQQVKDLILERIDRVEIQFLETPLMVVNAEEFRKWVNSL